MPDTPKEASPRQPGVSVRDALLVGVAILLVALLLRMFVLGAARIAGSSMEQTLVPGDFVVISKLVAFMPGFPAVGDVVAIRFGGVLKPGEPGSPGGVVVKRCVAGPGDTLMIRGSSVWVNGVNLRFPPTARPLLGRRDQTGYPALSDVGPTLVPRAGMTLALTPESLQQWRSLIENEGHTVALSGTGSITIDGEPSMQYCVARDYFFLLGDNMERSIDSRAWGVVPRTVIEGRVVGVYWSLDETSGHSSIRWDRIGRFVH
jgi:signal peptidase I